MAAAFTITPSSSLGLAQTFSNLKQQGKVAFIPYITAGDPDLLTTPEALKVLDSCGSDIIELGVPYSNPLVDGPIIQAAAACSLARGTNFEAIISMLREEKLSDVPPFPFRTQTELVSTCAGLHNFLRKECRSDEFPVEQDNEVDPEPINEVDPEPVNEVDPKPVFQTQEQQRTEANEWRDAIVLNMWMDAGHNENQ